MSNMTHEELAAVLMRLDEIEERCALVADGPWYVSTRPEIDIDETVQTGAHSFSHTGGYTGRDEYDHEGGVFFVNENSEPETLVTPWDKSLAKFIAHSREDLPAATVAIRVLCGIIAEMAEHMTKSCEADTEKCRWCMRIASGCRDGALITREDIAAIIEAVRRG